MLRRIHDPDHGASYLEYAAVIMLVAAIAGGVLTAGIPGRVSTMITDALDAIANGGQTQSQATGPAESGSDDEPPETGTEGQENEDKESEADKAPKDDAPAPKDEPFWSMPDVDLASLAPDPPDLTAPLGLGDPSGLTSSLLPGGGQLKTVGLQELNKKLDHDLYLEVPDLKLSDMHPNLMPLPDGAARDGWLGDQIRSFDQTTGDFFNETVTGLGNTFLHPQEAALKQGKELRDAGGSYLEHAQEYGTRLAEARNADDPIKAHLDVLRDAGEYYYIDAPWSPGKLVVNDSARESFSKGDAGGGISEGTTSVGSLFPPIKAVRLLGDGPERPSPRPPKPDPDKEHLAQQENAPGTGENNGNQDKDSDKPSCERNSFVAGTPVLLASGATVPIEDVEPGVEVLAFDPLTGEEGPREVTDTITGQGQKTLVDITITDTHGNTSTLTATDEHPFWTPKAAEWVNAADLQPGTWLRRASGNWARATSVDVRRVVQQQVHNLSVGDLNTYYVAPDGLTVLTHNEANACREDTRNEVNGAIKNGRWEDADLAVDKARERAKEARERANKKPTEENKKKANKAESFVDEQHAKVLDSKLENARNSRDKSNQKEATVGDAVRPVLREFNRQYGRNGSDGEVDVETNKAIIEVSSGENPAKGAQLKRLKESKSVNPNGKPVIVVGFDFRGNQVKAYEKQGVKVVRNTKELKDYLRGLGENI